jgi:hypothetical protein
MTTEPEGGERRNQNEKQGWKVVLGSVLLFILGLGLFGGLLPNRKMSIAMAIACRANLRMLNDVKVTWAKEYGMPSNSVPALADLIGEDKYIRAMPDCPRGGNYTLGAVKDRPRCSIMGHTF